MKKKQLARKLAENTQVTPAAAADSLDGVVHRILRSLKKGRPARLPGLGRFTPGRSPGFEFEREGHE